MSHGDIVECVYSGVHVVIDEMLDDRHFTAVGYDGAVFHIDMFRLAKSADDVASWELPWVGDGI